MNLERINNAIIELASATDETSALAIEFCKTINGISVIKSGKLFSISSPRFCLIKVDDKLELYLRDCNTDCFSPIKEHNNVY